MKETNLFQFVSVRSPEKKRISNLIAYEEYEDETGMMSRLGAEHNQVKTEDAENYLASENAVKSDAIEERIPGFLEYSGWLIENIQTLSVAATITNFESNTGIVVAEILNNEGLLAFRTDLWKTLFSKLVLSNSNENDFLHDQILAIEVALKLQDFENDTALVAFAGRSIEVPHGILLSKENDADTGGETSEPDNSEVELLINSYVSNLADSQEAIKEVKTAYQKKYEKAKAQSVISDEQLVVDENIDDSGETAKIIDPESPEEPTEEAQEETIDLTQIEPNVDFTFSQNVTDFLTEQDLYGEKLDLMQLLDSLEELSKVFARQLYSIRAKNENHYVIGNSVVAGRTAQSNNDNQSSAKTMGPDEDNRFVRPLGIGELKVVKQKLVCYEAGEIAHVENVLKGEHKERVTRRLEREEETYSIEREKTNETERDLQTTDRHEIETESNQVIKEESATNFGVNVTASYGPVSISASGGYTSLNSQTNSDKSSTSYAKEIVDKARKRVVEKVKTKKTTTFIKEFEETNTHGIDNKDGTAHTVGIYRWLDKTYEAQVYNYGKRLMFEFVVPEPAALYIHSRTGSGIGNIGVKPPLPLTEPTHSIGVLKSHADIETYNYDLYAAMYEVGDITPPPPEFKVVGLSFHNDPMQGDNSTATSYTHSTDQAKIPTGYVARQSISRVFMRGPIGMKVRLFIGRTNKAFGYRVSNVDEIGIDSIKTLNWETDILPISFSCWNSANVNMNIEIVCRVSSTHMNEWRIATYNKIVEGYNRKKRAYENELSKIQNQSAVTINGSNPYYNRITEREELKRSCIRLFTNQFFDSFDAMKYSSSDYPEFNTSEAKLDGKYIQFMEQAFEWQQMTYEFYPYYWGNKTKWMEKMNNEDNDPLFRQFLRSGAGRVVVPVRPTHNDAILYYLSTGGTIWEGGNPPLITDPKYVPIAADLKDENNEPSGDPWLIDLPTNLVILQKDAEGIDESGLPCEL